MKRLISGAQMIFTGMSQTASAMGSVLDSIPRCTLSLNTEPMTEAEAKVRLAELKAEYGLKGDSTPRKDMEPRRVRLGDFEDDIRALQGDMVVLGKDMRIAERRLNGVE